MDDTIYVTRSKHHALNVAAENGCLFQGMDGLYIECGAGTGVCRICASALYCPLTGNETGLKAGLQAEFTDVDLDSLREKASIRGEG